MENVVGSDHFHKGEEDPFSKGSSETGSCEGLIENTGGNSDRRLDDVGGRDVKPPFTVNSVRECIDACASYKDNECKRAIWTNNADGNFQRPCWLRGWNGVAKVPTKVGGYSSAHVQE
ncbi:hypothetical protein BDV29DRAFT_170137 [Aspergillus leporis]|uniref:Uncharacterized protein n=1 Tax=Aspergillus leporis TaxID=41062 RepID=A0A5N5X6L7_9EURO|nr:hypothetical protein BDV29DRAFT_170137 [Aspergillus leporis]